MAADASPDTGLRKFMRRSAVEAATGLPTSTLYAMMASGTFPRPIPLSPNGGRVAWLETDVIAWQEARLADRDKASA